MFLLDGAEPVDVAEVARAAVADGADLLGVAGGDGTQALVAGIAAEHGLPFVVITAGTRNHFALDLGLDRDDPAACLGALSDAVELRVDLGVIGGRTFVNNASFGAYAEVVEAPAYRGDKLRTTLQLLPDLLQGHRGAAADRPARTAWRSARRRRSSWQQPVRDRRHRRPWPSRPAGPRRARRGGRHGGQRARGGRPDPRQARRRAARADRAGRDGHRRHDAGCRSASTARR